MRKSSEQVLRDFDRRGQSIAEWARSNGYSRNLVLYVIHGGAAKRGKSHDIAVKLGLKRGQLREAAA